MYRFVIHENEFQGSAFNVIYPLLNHIASNFDHFTDSHPNTRVVILRSRWDCPKCCDSEIEGLRLIYLTTRENFWCQWAYQFAHEYLHHLIDGPMSGNNRGLKWFEETLCETASMFGLLLLSGWSGWDAMGLSRYTPSVREYLDDLLTKNQDLKQELNGLRSVRPWLPVLEEERYHRKHYNAIACKLLPLFCTNPSLWRIVPHIGDSESWQSLEELLSHLELTATADYQSSVRSMKHLLLGS